MPEKTGKAPLLVVFLTMFVDLLGFGIVLPLLPVYAANLGVDEHGFELGLLMASFSAMQFLFAPLWGRLSDRIGRRPVLIVGLAGSTFFYFLFGMATVWRSLPWLFITRLGAGVAGATVSTVQAYIADVTTLQTRAKGMALIGAAFGLGFTFGPLLAAAALVSAGGENELSPAPGFLASALSGVALLLAIFLLPESLHPGEPHEQPKLVHRRGFRAALATPSVLSLIFALFLGTVSFGSFETTLALMLSKKTGVFGFEIYSVSLYFAYIGVVLSLAQGVLVRRLTGHVGEAALATAGAIVSIVGFTLLAFASDSARLPLMFFATAVEVTGFALVTPSLNSLISRRSDPTKQGSILGFAQSMGSLARIIGPAMSIPLFYSRAVGNHTLPYWVAVGLLVVTLVMIQMAARSGQDFAAVAAE